MKFRALFNPESWLWKPLGYLGDLVMLSLLWTVFSVPVVTLGPASAALYDAVVHSIRRKEDTVLVRFFSTFKRELKQGILSTLIVLAAAAVLLGLPLLLLRARGGAYLLAVMPVPAFFLLCVLCWLWPVQSRFAMGLGALLNTSVRLAFGHILRSAAMAILWGAALYAGLRFAAPFFVCPALAALLSSYLIEPVFRKYEQA